MGIYIPNMQMPVGNEVVYIFSDGTVEKHILTLREVLETGNAVPVPPHGRLIDGNTQDVQIEALIERHLHGYTRSTWDFVCQLRDILKRNRTIIPAEEANP